MRVFYAAQQSVRGLRLELTRAARPRYSFPYGRQRRSLRYLHHSL